MKRFRSPGFLTGLLASVAMVAILLMRVALMAQQPITIEPSRANQSVVPYGWSAIHAPAANTQATATRAARQGFAHVATGIYFSFTAGSTAPAAVQVNVVLRDGPATTGTIAWEGSMSLPATAGVGATPISIPLFINGTPGQPMTIEFVAAGGANTFETVTLTGYDRP